MNSTEFNAHLKAYVERQIIPTGFSSLDKLLGGGLTPSLVVLGAVSSLGKSTFALQLAENISASFPVLYFSLEMPVSSIIAKSLTRRVHLRDRTLSKRAIDAGIKSGARTGIFAEAERECAAAFSSVTVYERTEKTPSFSAGLISSEVENFIRSSNGALPFVFVDYLQILTGSADGKYISEKQIVDENIQKLWLLAKRLNIVVFVISSLNRSSYDTEISFQSFKESGNIEYTADVVLGMQPAIFEERLRKGSDSPKKVEVRSELEEDVRDIDMKVLKNRYGKTGRKAMMKLSFNAPMSYFEDCGVRSESAASTEPTAPKPAPEKTEVITLK